MRVKNGQKKAHPQARFRLWFTFRPLGHCRRHHDKRASPPNNFPVMDYRLLLLSPPKQNILSVLQVVLHHDGAEDAPS
jgi:hypothetical protein